MKFATCCFQYVTKLEVLVCPKSYSECTTVAYADSDDYSVDIDVTSNTFTAGEEYYFIIQTKDGYASTKSDTIKIYDGCCGVNPSLKITT